MRSKFLCIAIIAVLTLSVSYIFIAGELKYDQAASGVVNLGFKNAQQTISKFDFEPLDIIIENQNSAETSFILTYNINGQTIVKKEFFVPADGQQEITAPEELKNYIIANRMTLKIFLLETKITWDKKTENLYKSINSIF